MEIWYQITIFFCFILQTIYNTQIMKLKLHYIGIIIYTMMCIHIQKKMIWSVEAWYDITTFKIVASMIIPNDTCTDVKFIYKHIWLVKWWFVKHKSPLNVTKLTLMIEYCIFWPATSNMNTLKIINPIILACEINQYCLESIFLDWNHWLKPWYQQL